ncbi:MAG: TIGR00730 family Rossman fold protein [Myxococcota bacterium]
MTALCVFCGSSSGNNAELVEAARTLGQAFGEARVGLVYGGASVGLMGELARSAVAAGAEVHGVLPKSLEKREIAEPGLTRLEIVEGMHARKARMYELASGFLALPGGFGTMDELFEVLTWNQIGVMHKPVGLIDIGDYYRPLVAFLDQATARGILRPEYRALLTVFTDPRGAVAALTKR